MKKHHKTYFYFFSNSLNTSLDLLILLYIPCSFILPYNNIFKFLNSTQTMDNYDNRDHFSILSIAISRVV
jgi:hypothetical protein